MFCAAFGSTPLAGGVLFVLTLVTVPAAAVDTLAIGLPLMKVAVHVEKSIPVSICVDGAPPLTPIPEELKLHPPSAPIDPWTVLAVAFARLTVTGKNVHEDPVELAEGGEAAPAVTGAMNSPAATNALAMGAARKK